MLDARGDEMRDDEFCKGISNSASRSPGLARAQSNTPPTLLSKEDLTQPRITDPRGFATHSLYYTSYLWRHTVKRMEAAGSIHGKGKRCVYKKIIRSILGRGSVKYDNSALISTCEVRTTCMDKAVQAWAELSREVLERHSHVVSSIPLLH